MYSVGLLLPRDKMGSVRDNIYGFIIAILHAAIFARDSQMKIEDRFRSDFMEIRLKTNNNNSL